eukprot:TRINITY_DN1417_c1_g1_i1.p1 TRINITY_DN1417_c1_g1~~TRINITY_DN1417_c1_g1_i1.p1  ORF type:complete len:135 (-),score=37.52 TRINITY_DN1417_c1_g1_i1:14-418(-)
MATVSAEAIRNYSEWNMNKLSAGYLIFHLKGGQIELTKMGDEGASWEELTSQFEADQPCWATYHFKYQNNDGDQRCKTILVRWAPERAKVQDKMQYSMWSKTLKGALSGIGAVIQACDVSDVDREIVLEKITRI